MITGLVFGLKIVLKSRYLIMGNSADNPKVIKLKYAHVAVK